MNDAAKLVAHSKLEALMGLCQTAECRRVKLLEYFGSTTKPCRNCDNCLSPPATWDGTAPARKVLSVVRACTQASGCGFSADHIIKVLLGFASVASVGHRTLPVFGCGAHSNQERWRSVIRELVMMRLLTVEHENQSVLSLGSGAEGVLSGERRVYLRCR